MFYKYGIKSLLARRTAGDKETFYTHTLFHYMPKIMKQTYKRHRLGVGVLTMEGFEYKNYSSKQAVNNRTNGQKDTNITVQSLRVPKLQFDCNYFDVKQEKNRRNRQTERHKQNREAEYSAIFDDGNNTITPTAAVENQNNDKRQNEINIQQV